MLFSSVQFDDTGEVTSQVGDIAGQVTGQVGDITGQVGDITGQVGDITLESQDNFRPQANSTKFISR